MWNLPLRVRAELASPLRLGQADLRALWELEGRKASNSFWKHGSPARCQSFHFRISGQDACIWVKLLCPQVNQLPLSKRAVSQVLPARVPQSHQGRAPWISWRKVLTAEGTVAPFPVFSCFFLSFFLLNGWVWFTDQKLLFPYIQTCWNTWGSSGINKRRICLWVSTRWDLQGLLMSSDKRRALRFCQDAVRKPLLKKPRSTRAYLALLELTQVSPAPCTHSSGVCRASHGEGVLAVNPQVQPCRCCPESSPALRWRRYFVTQYKILVRELFRKAYSTGPSSFGCLHTASLCISDLSLASHRGYSRA